jgi:hypothetical protein
MVRPARRRIVEPSFIRPGFDQLSGMAACLPKNS